MLDAGEVEAQLGREPLDQAQPVEVGVGVEARVAGRPRRADEPLRLVHAQGLGMHADQLGRDGDHVAGALGAHCLAALLTLASSSSSSRSFFEGFLGTAMRTRPRRSPFPPPLSFGAPWPRIRRSLPSSVPDGHLQREAVAVRRRHLDGGSERGLRIGDRHVDDEVVAAPLVEGRVLDARDDEQVAGRSAPETGLALALEPDARAVLDAGGDLDRVAARATLRPAPWQVSQGSSMTVPLPRQRGHGRESENSPWLSARTPRPLHSGQIVATFPALRPCRRKCDRTPRPRRGSAPRGPSSESSKDTFTCASTSAPRSAACRRAPPPAAAEEPAEEVAQVEVTEIDGRDPAPPGPGRGRPFVCRTRRRPALLGVGEDVVGGLDLLEALLGRRVARVAVGMLIARELAVRLLDLVGGGASWRRPACRRGSSAFTLCLRSGDDDSRGPQHAIAEPVALLDHLDHGALLLVGGLREQRLVHVRVEAGRSSRSRPGPPSRAGRGATLDEPYALLDRGLLVLRDGVERAPEVVEHGQQLAHEPLVRTRDQVSLVAGRPLAEVVEVRGDATAGRQILVPLGGEGVELQLEALLVAFALRLLLGREGSSFITTSSLPLRR